MEMKALEPRSIEGFVSRVRLLAEGRVSKALCQSALGINVNAVMPGKMLRTRLAGRLYDGGWSTVDCRSLQAVCAVTELVHTASLCHDDVVDNALVRRSMPTLWLEAGPSGAILVGDLLLCEATDLVMSTEGGRYLPEFVSKLREVVRSEAEQELLWRGKQVDVEMSLQLARGKTGPLFAFVAGVCGGNDETLSESLTEAGYRIGTAYQLADDLLDINGRPDIAGKTLGTDQLRRKYTLAQCGDSGQQITRETIDQMCTSAVELLKSYPEAQESLAEFLALDLEPVLKQFLGVDKGMLS